MREALQGGARSAEPGAAVAFRFAEHGRGPTKLYRLPDLEEVAWRFEGGAAGAATVVGFASDDDLVYWITDNQALMALDLASGRARVADSNVAVAALSPIGTPIVVRDDRSIATVQARTMHPWTSELDTLPLAIWAVAANRLIALLPGSPRRLALLAEGQNPVSQTIPEGDVVVSTWGEAAAVATDSGLVALDPARPEAVGFRRFDPSPTAVAFSASAHRVYVADGADRLHRVDRYSLDPLDRLELPGVAGAIRVDPLGRLALVRAADGDAIWIVDLARWEVTAVVAGAWSHDLPAVAPDGSVLVRRDREVVALAPPDFQSAAGRAGAARGDRWLAASWDPRRPVLELASDSAPGSGAVPAGQVIYVQVASTSNRDWADDLAGNLRRAGMNGSVLPPDREGDPFRVVLGPYASRDEAQADGRRLGGAPFWIFVRDTLTQNP